ncbi:PKD domain-containing protein, partial [Flexithrix dorotheae]|uniref:PKD domain-containing protein n=1 Tax=Flexithrix dorotheae TaxID=70993 RepID=UPI0005C657BF
MKFNYKLLFIGFILVNVIGLKNSFSQSITPASSIQCKDKFITFEGVGFSDSGGGGVGGGFGFGWIVSPNTGVTITDENAPVTTIKFTQEGVYSVTLLNISTEESASTSVTIGFSAGTLTGATNCSTGISQMTLSGHTGKIDEWQRRKIGSSSITSIAHQSATYLPTNNPDNYEYRVKLVEKVTCSSPLPPKYSNWVPVKIRPTANFTFSGIQKAGKTISFTNTSSVIHGAEVDSYSWNFGDGTPSSSLTNPTHSFSKAKTYNVSLTVTTKNGCTHTTSKSIEIDYDMYFTPHNLCAGSETFFIPSVVGGSSLEFSWDFGTGDGFTPFTNENQGYIGNEYDNFGNYSVKLKVRNEYNTVETISQNIYINEAPVINSINTPNDICQGMTIPLTASVTGNGTYSYKWNITGPTPGNYTGTNPSHKFTAAGSYNIKLTVSTSNEVCETITYKGITVQPEPDAQTMTTTGEHCNVENGFRIKLNNTQSGVKYLLHKNGIPVGAYNQTGDWGMIDIPGTYTVKATYTDPTLSCKVYDMPDVLVIKEKAKAVITFDNQSCNTATPGLVKFNSSGSIVVSDGTPSPYSWNFGDGNSSSAANPNHTYNQEGTYTVTLIITNDNGCKDETSKSVTVDFPTLVGEIKKIGGGNDFEVCPGAFPDLEIEDERGTRQWEYRNSETGSGFAPVRNPSTNQIITSKKLDYASGFILTENTEFRVRVKNKGCATLYTTPQTVTIKSGLVGGSISANDICGEGTIRMTLSENVIGDILEWQKEVSSGNFVKIENTEGNNYLDYFLDENTSEKIRVKVGWNECPGSFVTSTVIEIKAHSQPTANFRTENLTGEVTNEFLINEDIKFVNLSSAGANSSFSSRSWTFKPGATSTAEHPTYTGFDQAGEYPVKLIVRNNNTAQGSYCEDDITKNVVIHPLPVANINGPSDVCIGQVATFSITGLGIPNGYSLKGYKWDLYGDGIYSSLTTDAQKNVTYYPEERSIQIKVKVYIESNNSNHTKELYKEIYHDLNIHQGPTGTITASGSCPNESLTLGISNLYPNDIQVSNYYWDLDNDGDFDDGEGATIVSSFSEDTYVKVKLITENCEAELSGNIEIDPVITPSFTYQESCTEPGKVTFNVDQPNPDYIYKWIIDLSGGNPVEASGTQVIHQFDMGKTYYVKLSIEKEGICTDDFLNTEVEVFKFESAGEITTTSQEVCQNNLPTLYALDPVSGQNDQVSYQWQQSATENPNDFVDIAGATEASYAFPTFNQSMIDMPYYRRKVISENGCEKVSGSVHIEIREIPTTPTLEQTGIIELCPGETTTLSIDGNTTGFTYQWLRDGLPASTQNGSSTLEVKEPGIYTVMAYNNLCFSDVSDDLEVKVIPAHQPGIMFERTLNLNCADASTINLSIQSKPGYTYTWYKDGFEVGTGTTWSANATGFYYVKSVKTSNPGCYAISDEVEIIDKVVEPNYVRTFTAQTNGMVESVSLANADHNTVMVSTQYFDGLGRGIQGVEFRASPNEQDMVSFTQYDNNGRNLKSFLPFATGNNGLFKQCPESIQKAFYLADNDNIVDSDFAYGMSEVENSPLNRLMKQAAPGESWVGSLGTGDEHVVQSNQRTNTSVEGIIWWDIDYNSQSLDCGEYREGNLIYKGTYLEKQLMVSSMIDEQNHEVLEYKDRRGRVILKKVDSDDGWLETYYVYDDYGNLGFVLPPKAMKKMAGSYSGSTFDQIINHLAFQYKYDERNRLVVKKVPGTGDDQGIGGETYMVYDDLDRLILSQDANQRNREDKDGNPLPEQWSFTKYDKLSRPVITGVYEPSITGQTAHNQLICSVGSCDAIASSVTKSNFVVDPQKQEAQNLSLDFYSEKQTYVASKKAKLLPGFYYKADVGESITIENDEVTSSEAQRNGYEADQSCLGISNESVTDLVYTYYDDYGKVDFEYKIAKKTPVGAVVIDHSGEHAQKVKGQIVAIKTKRLGEGLPYLTTATFYDKKGRVLQTQGENHKKGVDIMTTDYDFIGRPKRTYEQHHVVGENMAEVRIVKDFTYDHAGRVKSIKQQIDEEIGSEILGELIVQNTYNELGELTSKALGEDIDGVFETIDYSYNIRGWLSEINNVDSISIPGYERYFAMELHYDVAGSENIQYNGNIGAVNWKSKLDGVSRGYAYTYDKVNRLKSAIYSSENVNEKFKVENITYDANGNILTLDRYGLLANHIDPLQRVYGKIDGLDYDYNQNDLGNRLTAVSDTEVGKGIANDFKENQLATGSEYLYDFNGNLISDANKGIAKITYNHLNLPEIIDFGGGKIIKYEYDAAGIKLKKTVFRPGKENETTDYIGGFVYENEVLQFFHMDEGRVLSPEVQQEQNPQADTYAYEYHYKDHLGNLRMSLRKGGDLEYIADMDTDKATEEEASFQNIAETRDVKAVTGNGTKSGDASAHLNANLPGGIQKAVGPLKEIAVGEGDEIVARVWARYTYDGNAEKSVFTVGSVLQNMVQGEGGGINTIPFGVNALTPEEADVPNAYIRIVYYDENDNELGDISKWVLPSGTGGWHPLDISLPITTNGKVKVFVANESEMDVWFDELVITNKKAIIAQENHYYPFGMNLTGIEKKGSPDHKFQYNGKEKQEDFDLNWYDYGWRNYDPALGRWHGVDGMSEKYVSYSPYHYAGNNPIRNYDIDGNEFTESGKKWAEKI